MIYKKEWESAHLIEKMHKGNNQTLLSAIAILEEVAGNVAEDGSLPRHAKQYLEEKFEILRRAIRTI